MDLARQASSIGALADDTRRALYEYVATQRDAVGREQAAGALGLATHTASFHLDRLVGEGLLETEFRRLTGRTGPGAGRPSKLYRRADREFAVALPGRRYDLAGEILSAAVDRAAAGEPLTEALDACAHEEGQALAREQGGSANLDGVAAALTTRSYEPFVDGDSLALANCPFDTLAQRHTELICGVNRSYVQGVLDGLGCTHLTARLAPTPDRCCVRVSPRRE